MNSEQTLKNEVENWLVNVVISLNLCPFAAKPYKNKQIKITLSKADDLPSLLNELKSCLQQLNAMPANDIDTELLVIPNQLNDFYDYLDFLTIAEDMLVEQGWSGVFQIASFHPNYCFDGIPSHADENLTNRAPYPIFHIIREDSMSKAVDHHPDVDSIPQRNIEVVESLTQTDKLRLFPYLFNHSR